MLGVPKHGHKKYVRWSHYLHRFCPRFESFVQSCPDVFSWVWGVGTLEPVDVCVCQMSFWTKLPWTNFGQLFGDLDKFGQRFLGLSNDFGREFEKHYIIEETRFS